MPGKGSPRDPSRRDGVTGALLRSARDFCGLVADPQMNRSGRYDPKISLRDRPVFFVQLNKHRGSVILSNFDNYDANIRRDKRQ